ncbi:MAG: glycoside hydrolase family 16 protein [Bacteroidia bacterium]|nr:glycoside hydrolase family 16 protein [Bacteroidia bacterium]
MDKEKSSEKATSNIAKKSVSNPMEDTYQPGPDWKLTWADDFEGETINENNWNLQVEKAGRFNDEWQRYTNSSDNAFIDDNCLVIKAIHESDKHGMDEYTSARVNSANKHSWKYGKIAARIKLPHGKGIWPAFWMLGANIDENGGDTPWPQCGEIDILELYGSKDNGVVECNIHYANESGSHESMGALSYKLDRGKFADNFHIFEFEWDANKMSWLVDGNQYASASISEDKFSEFHEEFFILLNMAVGGTYAGRPDNTTTFPQYMYIDWVRVYQKDI